MITKLSYQDVGRKVEVMTGEGQSQIGKILSYDNSLGKAKVVLSPKGEGFDWKSEPSTETNYELMLLLPEPEEEKK